MLELMTILLSSTVAGVAVHVAALRSSRRNDTSDRGA